MDFIPVGERTVGLVKRVSSGRIYKTGRICIGQSFVAMERHYDYILDLGHIIYKGTGNFFRRGVCMKEFRIEGRHAGKRR